MVVLFQLFQDIYYYQYYYHCFQMLTYHLITNIYNIYIENFI